MKIHLVTIAYKLADATRRLFESAVSEKHELHWHLFLHSNDPDVMHVCSEIMLASKNVIYRPYGVNRGLARSWNEGMLAAYQAGADMVIIVNDDCWFSPGDVDKLAEFAMDHSDKYVIPAMGFNHNLEKPDSIGFSCFALTRMALSKIGCFDENIFPIYFEDCDYQRRAALAGLELLNCPDTNVQHGGSRTLGTADSDYWMQHSETFNLNLDYYVRKWGGEPGKEVYRHPFNNRDFDLWIPPSERHAPYGEGYDRVDQDVVRI